MGSVFFPWFGRVLSELSFRAMGTPITGVHKKRKSLTNQNWNKTRQKPGQSFEQCQNTVEYR